MYTRMRKYIYVRVYMCMKRKGSDSAGTYQATHTHTHTQTHRLPSSNFPGERREEARLLYYQLAIVSPLFLIYIYICTIIYIYIYNIYAHTHTHTHTHIHTHRQPSNDIPGERRGSSPFPVRSATNKYPYIYTH
jgi:hypothetical protein